MTRTDPETKRRAVSASSTLPTPTTSQPVEGPPNKRCDCNVTAAETSILAIDGDVLSECLGCGATWSLSDGTPPDYIAWLLKTHFEKGAGVMQWSARFALASGMDDGAVKK